MNIRLATINDIPAIRAMADVVFRKTYEEILSPEQMEYMMNWMYSAESLKNQIEGEGKEFFIAQNEECKPCGFVSVENEGFTDDGRPLFHLQKLYVMPQTQGTGLGKVLINFLFDHLAGLHPQGCRVQLNVNRHNKAVGFYEKMGMHRIAEGDFDIGNGYYMNDYIYAKDLSAVN